MYSVQVGLKENLITDTYTKEIKFFCVCKKKCSCDIV